MDEQTATLILNMYAGSLAAQVVIACDKARVKVTGRRIAAVLDKLLPANTPQALGRDALLALVEDQVLRIQSSVSAAR